MNAKRLLDLTYCMFLIGDNQFPGVKYPPVILNVTSFTVYSYACIFTLYIYPVASRSNKTNSTIFDGNIALNGAGGGLHLYYGSNNNIFVNTDFINNQARGIGSSYGGGFYSWISSLSTICTQLYFRNNSAQTSGGGMALMSGNFGSSVLNSYFTENSATISGGSLYIGSSNGQGTYMQQNEFYINDTIITDSTAANGGGIFFDINNNVILTNCTLQNNSASGGGGGLYLSTGNQLQIYRSVLSRNQADGNGGGIASFAVNGLYLEEVNLHANQAHVMGGGIYLQGNSLLSIHSEVLVENNQAMFGGGGIAISEAPLWDVLSPNISHMEISGNQAGRGSGLFLYALTASDRSLENVTFASNVAQVGGTVYWLYDSVMTSAPAGLDSSSVVFSNNEVGYGEIATQALALLTPTSYNVTVYDKTLTPAISLNMTDYYSQFVRVSNITTVSVAEYQDSSGVGSNCAGRPASLSGSDRFGSGVVMQQGVAEFASLEAFCSPGGSMAVQFQAQPADLTSIPSAISQLYYVQNTSTFQFRDCLDGEYQSDGQCLVCTNGSYSLVAGVAECSSCVGKDGVAACYSNQLVIDLGYWRRYDNNEAVLQCPVVDGCIGGSATGNALCAVGYEGPLCSVCSDGYFFKDGLCQSCDSTNEMSITVIVIIALFGLLIGAVMSYYCYFYVYVDMVDLKRQIVDAINRGVPGPQLTIFQLLYLWIRKKMQDITVKVKIFISTFQVVSGCTSVFDVNMPNAFAAFADAFSFVNLDVYSIFPIGCAQQMNFMDELLLTTVAPLLCVGLMGLFLAAVYARMKHMASDEAIRQYEYMKDKVLTAFFFLTYLVLPSVSVTIFQTFICQNIDPDNEDSSQEDLFLVADMNISCTSTYYYSWVLYACMMLVVYPIGIPLCYFVMLYRNRAGIITRDEVLEKEEKEEKDGRTMSQRIADSLDKSVDYIHNPLKESVKSLDRVSSMIDMDDSLHKLPPQVARLSFLWAAYEPGFWYWEVIETFRRIMLTAVLSAIAPGTSSQNVFSIIVSVLFIKLYASHKPYEEDSDDALAELGQVQIFFTFLAVMCSQNDLLPGYYDTSMGVLLIVINLSLPLVAFYYEMHSYYEEQKALEAEGNEEDAGRGDSCILSRAKESFSKINARMFGPKAAKPSGKKVRRQSQSQTEADDSFSFAMHYIYQQNKQQPRPIVELGVAEGGDMEKGSWVEMNPIRQASIVDRNSARMSTKMKDIKNLEVDIRKPVVKDPENKQEEGEEVKSRSSVL
ncbi:hypothetical protein EON65_20285 [archaeon]|nr:MAG: hypothetical protein EON65_20285 [archaeon]